MDSAPPGKIRLAIIGAGGISHAHAVGILEHADKVDCVALCDVSESNLTARNEQLGGACRLFTDWKTMLSDFGDQIDAVDICLPHHLHAAAIMDAARAGKDVLCEKPLCTSMHDADEIVQTVRDTGILYQSAHNQLFMPCVREAKRRIEAGDIGEIRWLRSQDCFLLPPTVLGGQWRAERKLQGGGELIDTGYHPIYRLLHLADSAVTGVRASMARFQQVMEGEDTASVQIRFSSGAIGEIFTSWAFRQPFGSHQIHVIGSKGELFGSDETLWFRAHEAKEPQETELPKVDTFAAQMADFADRVVSRERPIHSVEEGRLVLEVITRAAADAAGWEDLAKQR